MLQQSVMIKIQYRWIVKLFYFILKTFRAALQLVVMDRLMSARASQDARLKSVSLVFRRRVLRTGSKLKLSQHIESDERADKKRRMKAYHRLAEAYFKFDQP